MSECPCEDSVPEVREGSRKPYVCHRQIAAEVGGARADDSLPVGFLCPGSWFHRFSCRLLLGVFVELVNKGGRSIVDIDDLNFELTDDGLFDELDTCL